MKIREKGQIACKTGFIFQIRLLEHVAIDPIVYSIMALVSYI